jgi:zinc and cadmium transporter
MASLEIWLLSLASVIVVSLISLIGVVTFLISTSRLKGLLLFFVSFAAGAMIGDAFIHIMPEAVKQYGFTLSISLYFIMGMMVFFVLEKFIHWRHCHVPTSKNHPHPFVYMNLLGDSVHNFIDGMVIAGSYIVSTPVGIATTIAVIFHEIPQEIGDFSVLIHGGFSKAKALFFNFITALTAVLGAVLSLLIAGRFENYSMFLLPFTAGGFMYIAGSDLIPELHKESASSSKSTLQFLGIVLGVGVMLLMLRFG